MSVFILIASIITLITLALLLLPLFNKRSVISYERQAQNIHFAKERLQELEAQLKNAAISATDYEALKLEIESTLADDIDLNNENASTPEPAQEHSNKKLITSLCLALPVMAIIAYALLGTPDAFNTITKAQQEPPSAQDVEQMVATIEQRLATNPADLEGWAVLSRTYLALGRYQDAQQSFIKLIELGGDSANVYAQLADTSALIAGGAINTEALAYINKALALDPQQPQALWLAGLHAAQNGQAEQAREFWGKLMPLLAGVPQQQQELQEIIEQTFASAAAKESEPINLNVAVKLSISVTITPSLSDKLSSEDTLFVFARGQNGRPPAPLAVKRLNASDLPVQITLSDADAMVPQFKLSLFEDIEVTARVSKSGDPIAQAGDMQSLPVKLKNSDTKTFEVVISEIVN